MTAVILHGTLGKPDDNWFPWLANQLEKLGVHATRPQLPTPEGQTPRNWLRAISESIFQIDPAEEIIIIAHSRSPLAVCQYLQTRSLPIRGCYFVAGFASRLPGDDEPYCSLNNPFDDLGADWLKVKQNCPRFVCFAGDNDPYVPLKISQDFASILNAELIVVPDGGHLNSESGFIQFPQLFEKIKSDLGL